MDFSDKIMDEVLFTGKKFYMGNNLTFLQIKRIERNPAKPKPDWPTTNKTRINGEVPRDEEGKPIIIYYTDKWFPLLYWNKKKTNIKHGKLYRLRMVRGTKGSMPRMREIFNKVTMINERFELQKRIIRIPKVKKEIV